jgi:uncharacterized protein
MFYNREQEKKNILSIIKTDPAFICFLYGPINSGKTNLITKVLDEPPDDIIPFYINLRGRNVSCSQDFLNILFTIDRKTKFKNISDYLKELVRDGADIIREGMGLPIPAKLFDIVFQSQGKGEDAFHYLELLFSALVMKKLKPVLVLDEIQLIKEIINGAGNSLFDNIFQFFIRVTKETHLCHIFAISSDSLFIQHIHAHSRLKGRSQYILIDDLDKERAFETYDDFGFSEKTRIWDYIGGKLGDMTMLKSFLSQGYELQESLDKMLIDEINALYLTQMRLFESDNSDFKKDSEKKFEFLFNVAKEEVFKFKAKNWREVEFWSDQNVLFMDPVKRIVKTQSRLGLKAIHEFEKNRD